MAEEVIEPAGAVESAHGQSGAPTPPPSTPEPPPVRRGLPAGVIALLALAVPGLGHALLGRPRRGAAFLLLVTITFAVGLLVDGRLSTLDRERPLSGLAALTTAATGILNVVARAAGWGAGDLRSPTYEYGTTFLLSAGLMNLLLVLDAADRARGGGS